MWLPKISRHIPFRENLSVAISLLALLVSAGNAYFSNLRQIDYLTVLPMQEPNFAIVDERRMLIEGYGIVVFTNSGTRAAAVLSLHVSVKQKLPGGSNDCVHQETDVFDTNLEPIVLKPGDITTKNFLVRADSNSSGVSRMAEGTYSIPVQSEFLIERGGLTFQVCYLFSVTTPSGVTTTQVDRGDFSINQRQASVGLARIVDETIPRSLVEQRSVWSFR